jgi:hypothetical protein
MRLLAALGLYLLASIVLFGRDVVTHPNGRIVGDDGADKTLYLWALEWWPWAVAHGRNPLDVDVAWAPHGFDFGLGTAGGGLALASAPLTALVGVVPTYNVLILLAPALAGAATFALAERLTGAFLPSLVAGWVFAFSSYELGRMVGHLPLAFVAFPPLAAYLVLRRYEGSLSRRVFVVLLALVLAGQFLVVTQLFFTLVVVGACTAALAALALGGGRLGSVLGEAAAAVGIALALLAPVLVYSVVSDAAPPARSAYAESADVLNYVVPNRRTWLAPPGSADVAARFTATGTEQGAYLGLPFLALALLALRRRSFSRARVTLALAFLVAVVLSLGTRPKFAGVDVGYGPWLAFAHLPVLESALPARLTLYASLFAALLIALALADRPPRWAWGLALLGILSTLPNPHLAQWSSAVPRPTFFSANRDAAHLRADETVLLLPYGPSGWSMLWQAEERFRFRIVGGHFALRVTPPEERWRDVYEGLSNGRVRAARLRPFLIEHDVDVVVVTPGTRPGTRRALERAAGGPDVHAGDAAVYRLGQADRMRSRRSSGRSRKRRRVCSLRSPEYAQPT